MEVYCNARDQISNSSNLKKENDMAISHEEVMAKLSPERLARIEVRTKELIEEEMTLRTVWPALTSFSHFERMKSIRIDSGMHLIAIRELRQAAAQFLRNFYDNTRSHFPR
jgi:hypothetical protein